MFGMSVFQSVLERLKAEDDEGRAPLEEPRMTAVRGLNAGFVGNITATGVANEGVVARAYVDTASDEMLAPPKPLPKPVMPDHLTRIGPREIAAELSFSDTETTTTLSEKRRRFAAVNHPDGHHADFRQNATIRMKIANMLIDEAQRRLRLMNRS